MRAEFETNSALTLISPSPDKAHTVTVPEHFNSFNHKIRWYKARRDLKQQNQNQFFSSPTGRGARQQQNQNQNQNTDENDSEWYIPYNGPYEAPPAPRDRERDSRSDRKGKLSGRHPCPSDVFHPATVSRGTYACCCLCALPVATGPRGQSP